MNILRMCAIFLPFLLDGCVVAWGGAYHIDAQTPEAITIHYDTNFIDGRVVDKLALSHCSAYGKVARLQDHQESVWRLSVKTFACQLPQASQP